PSTVTTFADPTGAATFVERTAVDRPLSVDVFRDRLIGLDPTNGKINNDVKFSLPMAGTLGLGYIVRFAQQWTQTGLSLGNLVYSLPLAPGEQQKIAILETTQTLSQAEIEGLEIAEQQSELRASDSSTQAVFDSAYVEAVRSASSYSTNA